MLVTIKDVRVAGFCAQGARRWFESHGFDFRDFMQNGMDSETLLATGDQMAIRVVSMKEIADGRG